MKKINDPKAELDTYEKCCAYLGQEAASFDNLPKHAVAYLKLSVITKAWNGGQIIPSPGQTFYAPRFYFEFDENGVLVGGYAYFGAYVGPFFVYSSYSPSSRTASLGARLCLKTRNMAEECGDAFLPLWYDYMMGIE